MNQISATIRSDGKALSVNHMQSNPKRRNLFASASKCVHVWRLGAGLVESVRGEREEQKAIDDIANEGISDD